MGLAMEKGIELRDSQGAKDGATRNPEELGEKELLLDSIAVAKMLNIGVRTLWAFTASGVVPAPIRLGGRMIRFSAIEIREWVKAGCPPRQVWEKTKKDHGLGRARR